MAFASYSAMVGLIPTGKVRILAVTSPERLKDVSDIATAVESGVPGMVAQLFIGVFAPIKTSRPIVDQIYQASQKAMTDPTMQKVLIEAGLEPITSSSPDKVAAFMQEESTRWAPVNTTSKATPPPWTATRSPATSASRPPAR